MQIQNKHLYAILRQHIIDMISNGSLQMAEFKVIHMIIQFDCDLNTLLSANEDCEMICGVQCMHAHTIKIQLRILCIFFCRYVC